MKKNENRKLSMKLERVQTAMEREMKSITLKDVKNDIENFIAMENLILDKQ